MAKFEMKITIAVSSFISFVEINKITPGIYKQNNTWNMKVHVQAEFD